MLQGESTRSFAFWKVLNGDFSTYEECKVVVVVVEWEMPSRLPSFLPFYSFQSLFPFILLSFPFFSRVHFDGTGMKENF